MFYNVIDGNGGNGLLVDNSNNTTIQANFFGMGANNDTAVGNALNGVVVEGTSAHTTMGGPIPLGNVDAANGQNGIVVSDKASFFTSYNTFCGRRRLATIRPSATAHDGMLLTSTGGNILIRTNVVTENGHDGIELSGAATGIRVTGNIIGLGLDGTSTIVPMGNVDNGVEVDGTAHGDVIGGPQPTFNVVPQNTISSNGTNGVAIDGHARGIAVNNSYIGTNVLGQQLSGNGAAGIYIGAGTSGNAIGSPLPSLLTVISGNGGDGIDMEGTTANIVVGTLIGTDATALSPWPMSATASSSTTAPATSLAASLPRMAADWPTSSPSTISTECSSNRESATASTRTRSTRMAGWASTWERGPTSIKRPPC